MQAGGVYLCANEIAITNLLDAFLCANTSLTTITILSKKQNFSIPAYNSVWTVAGTVFLCVSGNELVGAAFALGNGMVATSWTVFHCELTLK